MKIGYTSFPFDTNKHGSLGWKCVLFAVTTCLIIILSACGTAKGNELAVPTKQAQKAETVATSAVVATIRIAVSSTPAPKPASELIVTVPPEDWDKTAKVKVPESFFTLSNTSRTVLTAQEVAASFSNDAGYIKNEVEKLKRMGFIKRLYVDSNASDCNEASTSEYREIVMIVNWHKDTAGATANLAEWDKLLKNNSTFVATHESATIQGGKIFNFGDSICNAEQHVVFLTFVRHNVMISLAGVSLTKTDLEIAKHLETLATFLDAQVKAVAVPKTVDTVLTMPGEAEQTSTEQAASVAQTTPVPNVTFDDNRVITQYPWNWPDSPWKNWNDDRVITSYLEQYAQKYYPEDISGAIRHLKDVRFIAEYYRDSSIYGCKNAKQAGFTEQKISVKYYATSKGAVQHLAEINREYASNVPDLITKKSAKITDATIYLRKFVYNFSNVPPKNDNPDCKVDAKYISLRFRRGNVWGNIGIGSITMNNDELIAAAESLGQDLDVWINKLAQTRTPSTQLEVPPEYAYFNQPESSVVAANQDNSALEKLDVESFSCTYDNDANFSSGITIRSRSPRPVKVTVVAGWATVAAIGAIRYQDWGTGNDRLSKIIQPGETVNIILINVNDQVVHDPNSDRYLSGVAGDKYDECFTLEAGYFD